MGRVLLAGISERRLDALLANADLRALTPSTITSVERLRAEIERVRREGFALVDQELEPGLCSIAVPIHDGTGQVVAAVNLSTHASRASVDAIKRDLLPQLRATADRIERDLG